MKKLRIGVRLAISYGVLCALLVAVGASGLSQISAFNDEVDDITGDRWQKAQMAMQGLGLAGQQAAAVNELFLTTDAAEIERDLAHIEAIRAKASDLVGKREAVLRSERGRQVFKELGAFRVQYWEAFQRARAPSGFPSRSARSPAASSARATTSAWMPPSFLPEPSNCPTFAR